MELINGRHVCYTADFVEQKRLVFCKVAYLKHDVPADKLQTDCDALLI
jgi:hypothetical protein